MAARAFVATLLTAVALGLAPTPATAGSLYLIPDLRSTDGLGGQWLIGASVLGQSMCRPGVGFAWPGLRQLAHFDDRHFSSEQSFAAAFDEFVGFTGDPNITLLENVPEGAEREKLRHVNWFYAALPCARAAVRAAYRRTPKPLLPWAMRSDPLVIQVAVHVRRGDVTSAGGYPRFSPVALYCEQLPILGRQLLAAARATNEADEAGQRPPPPSRVRFHIFSEVGEEVGEDAAHITAACFHGHKIHAGAGTRGRGDGGGKSGGERRVPPEQPPSLQSLPGGAFEVFHYIDGPLDVAVAAMVEADLLVRAMSSLSDMAALVRTGASTLITERWLGRPDPWRMSGHHTGCEARGSGGGDGGGDGGGRRATTLERFDGKKAVVLAASEEIDEVAGSSGGFRRIRSSSSSSSGGGISSGSSGGSSLEAAFRLAAPRRALGGTRPVDAAFGDNLGRKSDYWHAVHDPCCGANTACCSTAPPESDGEIYPGG